MLTLTLMRMPLPGHTTYGVLYNEGTPFALTLELPWINNVRRISCIPAGRYVCKRVQSPKFGDTFEVTNVSGRSAILFHKGNINADTHGCIVLGESFEPVLGVRGLAQSGHAFDEFMGILKDVDTFTLKISQLALPPYPLQ